MHTAASQKRAFYGIMGTLTSIASYGCLWQTRRYLESCKRWDKIYEELNNFNPYELNGSETETYPWQKEDNLNDWEYRLVKLAGYFKEDRFFVRRMRDSRVGYYIFAPFVTAINNDTLTENDIVESCILVNIGWVPRENKEDIMIANDSTSTPESSKKDDQSKENKNKQSKNPVQVHKIKLSHITGLVRKGETQDMSKENASFNEEGVYQYINLPSMTKLANISNYDTLPQAYLEKMIGIQDDESDQLYPVPATKETFLKPYLTPRKHLEYATFWAGATIIGLSSMLVHGIK